MILKINVFDGFFIFILIMLGFIENTNFNIKVLYLELVVSVLNLKQFNYLMF